ncbi:hypothetical protein BJY00DRAFT_289959 [Aspergillus carlsbadensis]|nr:hypothetical protein BJY00DRAFT_289959 [Aspergillus carlsbadensis]
MTRIVFLLLMVPHLHNTHGCQENPKIDRSSVHIRLGTSATSERDNVAHIFPYMQGKHGSPSDRRRPASPRLPCRIEAKPDGGKLAIVPDLPREPLSVQHGTYISMIAVRYGASWADRRLNEMVTALSPTKS